jgi:transmembrane sensor
VTDQTPPDGELLDRYLAGETTEAETAAVRRYFMAHPDAARRLKQFVDRLEGADSRSLAPTRRSLARQQGQHARRATLDVRRIARYALVAAAAIALVLVPRAIVRHRAVGGNSSPRVYVTAPRERAELFLTDGSHVRLAPGSRLRVAADFGLDRRDVYLEGLAYFDIVHDARRPFTVIARNATALDLGTRFVVSAYAEDSAVQVGVRSGAVMLSGVGQLRAGDVGQLQSDGRARRWRGEADDALLSWLDNRLVYRDTPLRRVLRDIHRWYDVDVRVAEPTLAALPFSGVLTEQSSGAVIDRVAATLGLRVRRDSSTVVLER